MKNNFKNFLIVFLILATNVLADDFEFESSKIVISNNGNIVESEKGKVISKDGDLEIIGNNFKYNKKRNILEVNDGGNAVFKSKNIKIEFNEAIFNKSSGIIIANGNVKILDTKNKFVLKTEKIQFDEKNNLINSKKESQLEDYLGNIYIFEEFSLDNNKNLIKIRNLSFFDNEKNKIQSELVFFNTKTGNLFGKDISMNLSKSYVGNENEPRLKGNSFNKSDTSTVIKKGVFTNCKTRDGCPPWQIHAKKIKHDTKKKTIYYDDATLKVYDVPVLYFPKFFHPDPSVKRQSGFLVPSVKNSSNGGDYLSLPYFLAIAENKDATISPRIFTGQKLLLQTEYRQLSKMNIHNLDTSMFLEENKNSKTHLFYDFKRDLDFQNFEESDLIFKTQNTSNDTYLKLNDIESDVVQNNQVLENNLTINLYSDDLSLDISTKRYENLNKKNNNKYENIFSEINFAKNLNYLESHDGELKFKSKLLSRNFDSNIYEYTNVNDIIFQSFKKISDFGFNSDYQIILKNFNNTSKNSTTLKNHETASIGSILQYNSSLPLKKDSKDYQKIFNPKMSLKFSPTHATNRKNEYSRVDIDNVYSINRTVTNNRSVEEGVSATLGSNYSVFDKKKSKEILEIDFANNFRIDNSNNLPYNNQIDQKTSNFFNKISFEPNNFFKTTYKSSIKNNLRDITYEKLIANITIGNLLSSFEYLNENESITKNTYLSNSLKYNFNNSNSINFSTRENKSENLTEYYNLIYEYKNDCLTASIDYKKNYYTDRDIKPSENLFFKLTIIPFGETSSPDLKR